MATNPIILIKANLKIFEMKQDIKKFLKHVDYSEQLRPDINDEDGDDDKVILEGNFINNKGWKPHDTYLYLRMYDYDKITVKKTLDMLKKYGLTQENYNLSEPVEAGKTRHPLDPKGSYFYTVYMYIPIDSKDAMQSLFFDALKSEIKMEPYREILCRTYKALTIFAASKQK